MRGVQQEERERGSPGRQRGVAVGRLLRGAGAGRGVLRAALRAALPARLGLPAGARALPPPPAPVAAVPQLLLTARTISLQLGSWHH